MIELSKVQILEALDSVKRYQPKQGNLSGFVHHNTLHDFEDMEFHEAIRHVAATRGCGAYASLNFFKTAYKSGRIQKKDLFDESSSELREKIYSLSRTYSLEPVNLLSSLIFIDNRNENSTSLVWKIRNGLLDPDSAEAWTIAKELYSNGQSQDISSESVTYGYNLERCNELSYRYFCQLFDTGFSHWPISSETNLLSTFLDCILTPNALIPKQIRILKLSHEFLAKVHAEIQTIDAISICLSYLNISEAELSQFFLWALSDVGGFSGLALARDAKDKESKEFQGLVAIRLLILIGSGATPSTLRETKRISNANHTAALKISAIFQGIQILEVSNKLQNEDRATLIEALTILQNGERFRILQVAYEKKYYRNVCSVLQAKTVKPKLSNSNDRVSGYSAIFCIDEREESLRRHLEEVDSTVNTYGYAGFFNMDMLFQPAGSHEQHALCPVSINPNKIIRESYRKEGNFSKTANTFIQPIRRFIHQKSRTLFFGTVLHVWVAFFTAFADMLRLVSPRSHSKITRGIWKLLEESAPTSIDLDRSLDSENSFSADDYANRIISMLMTCGIPKKWDTLIYIIGHGSSSLNNPHESAHDCGACSGQRGGPNARVFALAANHPLVRENMKKMEFHIPDFVHFVGGYHDTCSDDFIYCDLDQIPEELRESHKRHANKIQSACELDAQERARRFESIAECSPKKAFVKVQARALKYAQPRPEYGHATNALCIVGDRAHSKHVFLDRRAFLCSYDNDLDATGEHLEKLLSAVVPVCAGINLEYYFSFIDNEKYGCGTKLPHNVTGLAGVMNGSLSDLRTGLPWQMVEIHEPVRLLMIIYVPLKKMLSLKTKIPYVFDLINRGWVNAVFKDDAGGTFVNINGEPVDLNQNTQKSYASSCDVYRGNREHIDAVMLARSFS